MRGRRRRRPTSSRPTRAHDLRRRPGPPPTVRRTLKSSLYPIPSLCTNMNSTKKALNSSDSSAMRFVKVACSTSAWSAARRQHLVSTNFNNSSAALSATPSACPRSRWRSSSLSAAHRAQVNFPRPPRPSWPGISPRRRCAGWVGSTAKRSASSGEFLYSSTYSKNCSGVFFSNWVVS